MADNQPEISDADFALEMVNKLRDLLRKSVGMVSVTVDGQTVTFQALQDQHEFWRRKLARLTGKKPIVTGINLEFAGE